MQTRERLIEIIYRALAVGPVITPETLKLKAEQIADAIIADQTSGQ